MACASGTGLVQQSSPFEFGKDAQHLKDALPPGVVVLRPIFNACSSDRKPTKSGRLWPSRSTDQAVTVSNSEALPSLDRHAGPFPAQLGRSPKSQCRRNAAGPALSSRPGATIVAGIRAGTEQEIEYGNLVLEFAVQLRILGVALVAHPFDRDAGGGEHGLVKIGFR